jgi:hypothetical protein
MTRMLVPRSARKAMNPMSALGGAIMPRPVKQARRAIYTVTNPVGALGGAIEDVAVEALRPRAARRPRTVSRSTGGGSAASEQRLLEIQECALENEALDWILAMHSQPVLDATRPLAPAPEPVDREALRRRREREAANGIRLWHRTARREARQRGAAVAREEADAEERRRVEEVASEQAGLDHEWNALLQHDSPAVLAALERAFNETTYPAIGLGATEDAAIVFVGFRDSDVVPDREVALTPTGRPTLKKRSKTVRNQLYAEALAAFTLGNARLSLASTPGAKQAVVVALRPFLTTDGWEAVARIRVPREAVTPWPHESSGLHIFEQLGGSLAQRGRTREVVEVDFDDEPQLARVVAPLKDGENAIRAAADELADEPNVRLTITD